MVARVFGRVAKVVATLLLEFYEGCCAIARWLL